MVALKYRISLESLTVLDLFKKYDTLVILLRISNILCGS